MKLINLSPMLSLVPIIHQSMSCKQTLDVLRMYPQSEAIIVTGDNGRTIGLVHASSFYLKISGGFGIENLYPCPVQVMMTSSPLQIDIHITADELLMTLHSNLSYPHGIIVSDREKPLGLLPHARWQELYHSYMLLSTKAESLAHF